jgi:hypothetical protein
MKTARTWVCLGLGLLLAFGAGCASSNVQTGALIGAGTGAALGAGTGYLVTDENLLGSSTSKESGDMSLPQAETIAAGAAIGLVVGAIVGAMVGHQREERWVKKKVVLPPPDGEQASAVEIIPAPRSL